MMLSILILAAGSSSRMRGGDKVLEPVGGVPLLARIAGLALGTGLPVHVVLPPDRPARQAALQGLQVTRVVADAASGGMAESLKAGLASIAPESGVMLLLADLPELTAQDLSLLLAAWRSEPEAILRGAAQDGRPGHPVCFPPDLRDELMGLKGDEGARAVIVRHRARVRLVPLAASHAVTDLDTPEDWAAWRAALSGQSGA